ncbi:hypothetical protein [Methylotenera sp.]|uniref:hypothetical protein n=1 Tax=Methylotenera sp. TaxID=2051956 RepID=UPI0027373D63|nr:hypothetical protein [Methylotenera sp.]MDP3308288.1 hypothetical protein [Methylotenera sp.]
MKLPEWLKTTLATVVVGAVFLAGLNYVSATQQVAAINPQLLSCVPASEAEMVVLRLRQGELQCERHERYRIR